uniref:NADH dehydrogenase subunit 4L n=1 Tax=Athripsodes aterrimus TaxID=699862 RepID=A0A7D6W943_9NEOP|nr:NADH dehydrogenase subunit 4L [Athripsodes aterrimus]
MKLILMGIFYSFFIMNLIFCLYRKYFLVMLLMLEFMVLNIFFILNLMLMFLSMDFFFLMIFLVITVCEGVLGISILVNMLRMYGMDYFLIFSILL